MAIQPYDPAEIVPASDLETAGQVANVYAQRAVFPDYLERKAPNTTRRQLADLARFAEYLAGAGIVRKPKDLQKGPDAWQGVTFGLVEGFKLWMKAHGDAIGSINIRLSTVKTYARLASKAGSIPTGELVLIRAVEGYSVAEGRNVDELRTVKRRGWKKAAPVAISPELAGKLKRQQPDTSQGRRDAVLMCLLLDHGLRCGEVAILQVTDFDLKAGTFTFYRPKVGMQQTHKLTDDSKRALLAYILAGDAPAMGPLLRESRKGGALGAAGMAVQNITARVRTLGGVVGLAGLSAHDCRHYWATTAARNKTPIDRLQQAGGWSSPAMPLRYIEGAKIANQGVELGSDDDQAGGGSLRSEIAEVAGTVATPEPDDRSDRKPKRRPSKRQAATQQRVAELEAALERIKDQAARRDASPAVVLGAIDYEIKRLGGEG